MHSRTHEGAAQVAICIKETFLKIKMGMWNEPIFHSMWLHFDTRSAVSKFICKITYWSWPYVVYIKDSGNNINENPMVDHRKPTMLMTCPISCKFVQNWIKITLQYPLGKGLALSCCPIQSPCKVCFSAESGVNPSSAILKEGNSLTVCDHIINKRVCECQHTRMLWERNIWMKILIH